ncbi:MAG: hypothetical protein WAU45_25055 [Blastocatellia bacterium]
MQESNDEIARRVLASVLERLDASGSRRDEASALNKASRSSAGSDPVVVVVLGQVNSHSTISEDAERTLNEPLSLAAGGSQSSFADSSHPGLEKFELPKQSPNARAPKTCFMEPDRPCVNSGVCEMRGY